MKTLRIWTDGCCLRNPGGAGGWAFVAEVGGKVLDSGSGGADSTTNNRMELTAIVEGLRWVNGAGSIEVLSDSRYAVDGASRWMPGWKRRGWRRGKIGRGAEVKNADLWRAVDELLHGDLSVATVGFRWVKGHAHHEFNNMADVMAAQAAESIGADDPAEAFVERFGL